MYVVRVRVGRHVRDVSISILVAACVCHVTVLGTRHWFEIFSTLWMNVYTLRFEVAQMSAGTGELGLPAAQLPSNTWISLKVWRKWAHSQGSIGPWRGRNQTRSKLMDALGSLLPT